MSDNPLDSNNNQFNTVIRTALGLGSILVPPLSALPILASLWSEYDQEQVNNFLKYRQKMLEDEILEQLEMIRQIMTRLNEMQTDVSERLQTKEFQSLFDKCIKNWSSISSDAKKGYVKNLLLCSAASDMVEDDIVRIFIDWIFKYSDLHFKVVSTIYQNPQGISRGEIWKQLGYGHVRDDSYEADLYKLLIDNLSTGRIIRQYRQTNSQGQFMKERRKQNNHSETLESAFDKSKPYVLTELGKKFVHYAISETTLKLNSNSLS